MDVITIPDSNIRILAPLEALDYFDRQSAQLTTVLTPIEAWNLILQDPQPMLKLAFKIRDGISTRFGVKAIKGFSGKPAGPVSVGDYLDFFRVEHSDSTALVLTERDRHLDVMTCISTEGPHLSITSSVQVHNLFGRAYMVPVGIAHKYIVRNMLRRLVRKAA